VLATFPMVAGVPGAYTIFNVVFFVVLLSSIIQGPTMNWMAARLNISSREDAAARQAPEAVPRA
jgi:potassium/hydrogen antiporter